MKRFFAALALCALLVPAAVGAQAKIVDSKIGVYVKYGGANIRIDKIESVRHSDGNPILGGSGTSDDNGYLIVSASVQNPGTAEIFMPNFRTTLFLEDQSKVDTDYRGPFVGAKTTEAPARLAPKESIRVRYVVPDWPGTRITKILLDPNDTTPLLRFQIDANTIVPLAEVPLPKQTDS
jgi:hypothetical protein